MTCRSTPRSSCIADARARKAKKEYSSRSQAAVASACKVKLVSRIQV
jgi:hypothetical protein